MITSAPRCTKTSAAELGVDVEMAFPVDFVSHPPSTGGRRKRKASVLEWIARLVPWLMFFAIYAAGVRGVLFAGLWILAIVVSLVVQVLFDVSPRSAILALLSTGEQVLLAHNTLLPGRVLGVLHRYEPEAGFSVVGVDETKLHKAVTITVQSDMFSVSRMFEREANRYERSHARLRDSV